MKTWKISFKTIMRVIWTGLEFVSGEPVARSVNAA